MAGFDTYCGLDCENCGYRVPMGCGGCIATGGKPFHGHCDVAECAVRRGRRFCGECPDFPCGTLKGYSYDQVHGDNGARITRCSEIKAALVAEARAGTDPVAYCGFSCNHCFLGKWCGSCRSDYNCCSYATICEGGVCPQAACCRGKGLDGCWECPDLSGCLKGYYGREAGGEYACKAAALFIRQYGKAGFLRALAALQSAHAESQKYLDARGSVQGALKALEGFRE